MRKIMVRKSYRVGVLFAVVVLAAGAAASKATTATQAAQEAPA